MNLKVIALLNIAWIVACEYAVSEQMVKFERHGKLSHIGENEPEHRELYAPSFPSYKFSYKVSDPHTHDFKGQTESRHGDVVKGVYWLIEPTGNKRTVTYYVDDKSGFLAVVHNSKKGEIKYYYPYKPHKNHNDMRNEIEENDQPGIDEIDPRSLESEDREDNIEIRIQDEDSPSQLSLMQKLNNEGSKPEIQVQQILPNNMQNVRNHHPTAQELDEAHAQIERKVDLQKISPRYENNPYQPFNQGMYGSRRNLLSRPHYRQMPIHNERYHLPLIHRMNDKRQVNRKDQIRVTIIPPIVQEKRRNSLLQRLINHTSIQCKIKSKTYDIRPLNNKINPGLSGSSRELEHNKENGNRSPILHKYILVKHEKSRDTFPSVDKIRQNYRETATENLPEREPVKINRHPIIYERYVNPIIHRIPSSQKGAKMNLPIHNIPLKSVNTNRYNLEQHPHPIENEQHYDNHEEYEMGLASEAMKNIQRLKPIFRQVRGNRKRRINAKS